MAQIRQRTLSEKVASAIHILEDRKRGLYGTTEKAFYRMNVASRDTRCEEAEALLDVLKSVGVKLEITNNFPV